MKIDHHEYVGKLLAVNKLVLGIISISVTLSPWQYRFENKRHTYSLRSNVFR